MINLDDLDSIKPIDSSGMLRLIEDFPKLMVEGYNFSWVNEPTPSGGEISNILIVGFGGSAISGDILKDWLVDKLPVPLEVCRSLRLPGYVCDDTLTIIISYSGETLETLQLLTSALKRDCKIVAVTSGGLIGEVCERRRISMLKVRGGLPPRAALPLLLSATVKALNTFQPLPDISDFRRTVGELESKSDLWRPEVELNLNPCKRLAIELLDSIPTIYVSERLSSVARRIKDQFNENSKVPARFDLIPEACHNEVEGWSRNFLTSYVEPKHSILIIRDSHETIDETVRMEAFKDLLESVGLNLREVRIGAYTRLGGLLLPILFGDYVSAYLALAKGVDPTPIPAIEALKSIVEAKTDLRLTLRRELLNS
ncbi:MAG: bifunctional phosphoglucose/phosphomannose isomerase [Candidatus Bathyarchaeia archaeon]